MARSLFSLAAGKVLPDDSGSAAVELERYSVVGSWAWGKDCSSKRRQACQQLRKADLARDEVTALR